MRDRNAPGRPREFDDTEMLRKIMKLFWKGGYEGVSLSDIMRETGLQKASLYAAFGDKRALYLKALTQYHADVVSDAARALKDANRPALERIEAFLLAPLEAARLNDRSGCFLCNASADQADLDLATKQQVKRGFETLTQALAQPIAELRPKRDEVAVLTTARTLVSIYIGLRIMVRSGLSLRQLESCVPNALVLVNGCSN